MSIRASSGSASDAASSSAEMSSQRLLDAFDGEVFAASALPLPLPLCPFRPFSSPRLLSGDVLIVVDVCEEEREWVKEWASECRFDGELDMLDRGGRVVGLAFRVR